MAKCSFCETKLPEEGFTHYMLVETRVSRGTPCCGPCRRRMKLKAVALMRDGEGRMMEKEPT